MGGEVGKNHIGARAFDGGEGFEDGGVFVEPARGGSGFDHEIFAADLVGGEGEGGGLAELGDDVEVGTRGFDHDHVCAFGFVELELANRFAGVGGIHLVGFFIAVFGGGIECATERAVEGGGVFRGVGEDGDVLEAFVVEGGADGGDAAVHHVAWGDDVCASAGVGEGLLDEDFDGFIV